MTAMYSTYIAGHDKELTTLPDSEVLFALAKTSVSSTIKQNTKLSLDTSHQ